VIRLTIDTLPHKKTHDVQGFQTKKYYRISLFHVFQGILRKLQYRRFICAKIWYGLILRRNL